MEINLNREDDNTTVSSLIVIAGNNEFKISVDKFNNMVVNKIYGSGDDGCIHITPSVSNEIKIN